MRNDQRLNFVGDTFGILEVLAVKLTGKIANVSGQVGRRTLIFPLASLGGADTQKDDSQQQSGRYSCPPGPSPFVDPAAVRQAFTANATGVNGPPS